MIKNYALILIVFLITSCTRKIPYVDVTGTPATVEEEILSKNDPRFRISFNKNKTRLFFTASQKSGNESTLGIWQSQKSAGEWTEPEALPVNSEYDDYSPWFAPDETILYFVSKRPGGAGNADIWWAELNDDGTWAEPVNLGAPINTPGNEEGIYITPDNRFLIFSTDNKSNSDIFCSENWGGYWAPPDSFSLLVNSRFDEFDPWINPRGTFVLFSSTRQDTVNHTADIWYTYRSPYGWDVPPKPLKKINSEQNERSVCLIDSALYFARTDKSGKGTAYTVKAKILHLDKIKVIIPPKNVIQ